jgi:hypothetical protein
MIGKVITSIQFNDHASAFGFVLQAGIVEAGWA